MLITPSAGFMILIITTSAFDQLPGYSMLYFCGMNNYDRVFSSIKKYSAIDGFLKGDSCFEVIVRDAQVSYGTLFPYLTNLQDLGFIKYSFDDSFIELTELGEKQEKLFGN